MPALEAKRTLVKSPPEIWAEVSDAGALARHLGEFGEIRITRTQPESVVEWEGDLASGCVRLEPSGWGTKVTLTAEATEPPAPEPEPEAEPEPAAPAARRPGGAASGAAAEEPVVEAAPRARPGPGAGPRSTAAQATLTGVLDTLGAAHHRPFRPEAPRRVAPPSAGS